MLIQRKNNPSNPSNANKTLTKEEGKRELMMISHNNLMIHDFDLVFMCIDQISDSTLSQKTSWTMMIKHGVS